MTDVLHVVIDGLPAGVARRTDGGVWFTYDDGYVATPGATPLSLSVPIGGGREHRIESWMDGLLPQDSMVLRRLAARHGAVVPSTFDLMATRLGHDCAGSVQFVRTGYETEQLAAADHTSDERARTEVRAAIRHFVDELIPLAEHWPDAGVVGDSSLAGAKAKMALAQNADGTFSVPSAERPSTHIFKPSPLRMDHLAVVEHLCLRATHRLGLSAAATELVSLPRSWSMLVVTRYDRFFGAERATRRHQEDLCQALGLSPGRLYQAYGGPSIAAQADLLRAHSSSPLSCVGGFFDALVFHWLVMNPDAHSKNHSLLFDGDGVRLAPLYDVWSQLPYDPGYAESYSMAMWPLSAGDEHRFVDAERPSYWIDVATELGLEPDRALERVGVLTEGLPEALAQASADTPEEFRELPVAVRTVDGLSERALRLAAIFR